MSEHTQLYRHYGEGSALLYVGISLSTFQRLLQHRDHSHWFDKITSVTIEHFDTRKAALAAERAAIHTEKPLFNVQHNFKEVARNGPSFDDTLLPVNNDNDERVKASLRGTLSYIVTYRPIYTVEQAAETLCVRPKVVRNAIESGNLGHIIIPREREGWQPKLLITGWQLLEYIEHKQQKMVA